MKKPSKKHLKNEVEKIYIKQSSNNDAKLNPKVFQKPLKVNEKIKQLSNSRQCDPN